MTRWQQVSMTFALALIFAVGGYYFHRLMDGRDTDTIDKQIANPYVSPPVSVIGNAVEDFSLSDISGRQRSLSEWQDKIIAVNFWATWCAPCLKEIPDFVALQKKYADKGLQFIGIGLERADEVKNFVKKVSINYPLLIGGDEVIEIGQLLGNHIGALPYTAFIDRDGIITYTKTGPLPKVEAERVINSLLSR